MSQLAAQGNILTMMLGPMSLLGVASLYDYVKTQWSSIIVGVISYCFFSYFGALGAFYIGEQDLRIYFALLLILIAGIQLFPLLKKNYPISCVNPWDHPQAKLNRLTRKSRISADSGKQYLIFLFYCLNSTGYMGSLKVTLLSVRQFSAKHVILIRNT